MSGHACISFFTCMVLFARTFFMVNWMVYSPLLPCIEPFISTALDEWWRDLIWSAYRESKVSCRFKMLAICLVLTGLRVKLMMTLCDWKRLVSCFFLYHRRTWAELLRAIRCSTASFLSLDFALVYLPLYEENTENTSKTFAEKQVSEDYRKHFTTKWSGPNILNWEL